MEEELRTEKKLSSSSSRKRNHPTEGSSKDDADRDRDSHHKKRRKSERNYDEDRERRGEDEERKHHKHNLQRNIDYSDDEGLDRESKHHRSKKHRDRGSDDERKHRKHKHHKKDRDKGKGKSKNEDSSGRGMQIVDDDPDDRALWQEKDLTLDGERVLATDIPTAESLKITSTAENRQDTALTGASSTETPLKRDEWMLTPASRPTIPADDLHTGVKQQLSLSEQSLTEDYGEPSGGSRNSAGNVDFFSSLGTERKKNPKVMKPNPDDGPVIHAKELNQDLKDGKSISFDEPPPPVKAATPGGPGSSWRMMRLRKVYEAAEEEGRPIEEIGVDRFGSLSAFEDAVEERRILDERQGKKAERDRGRQPDRETKQQGGGAKGFMFNDFGDSVGSSRSSSAFKRPGTSTSALQSGPSTPSPGSGMKPAVNKRLDSLRLPSQANSPLQQRPHTPIPSVMTPPPLAAARAGGGRALSPSSLNKLQAKVLRAKLMGAPNADILEKEYEEEAKRAHGYDTSTSVRTKVEVLPTLDARGRLYDVGSGGKEEEAQMPGNRKKKEPKFETHDPKTGEIIRINADDDEMTLGEMLRQERFGAGMDDQKNLDSQFARAIMGDGKFQSNLDYLDENAEKLGRQKMRSDGMKRQFAINDYKRTQKVLSTCQFCYGEDDSPPKAPVIAMGTRTYLSCTLTEELVPGHCLIVPIQHHLVMLEGDDDVWDEVRNFMKCLMRMFAEEDKGVIFYETVISLKWQKHTVIECVPLPWETYDLIPGYFKESILASEAEWSQHKKLIDFSARPGGFRRAMVPNLPYFMVQFDYKGEKGYGHVIEGTTDSMEDPDGLEEGEKGGGDFPQYFAGEIVGSVLEIEARRWRKPKRINFSSNKERVEGFRAKALFAQIAILLPTLMAVAAPTKREILIVVFLLSFFLLLSNVRSSPREMLTAALSRSPAHTDVVPSETETKPEVAPVDTTRLPFNSRLTWNANPVPETKIIAHVPGWTVFDRLYILNGVVYIVSDEASTVPDIQFIYSKGSWVREGAAEEESRLPTDKDIRVISTHEARRLFGTGAQIIDGVNLFVNDAPQYITHYYHWSAELWFGFWRTYSSLDPFIPSRGNTTLPPLRRIVFNRFDNHHWRDYAAMNEWVIRSSFPSVTLEFKDDWLDRAEMGRVFVFDRVILADRSAAMLSYNYARYQRTAGAAFGLPGSVNWWMPIRNNVVQFAGLDPNTGGGTSSKPVITYISRQDWGRRMLKPEDHARLVTKLRELEKEYGYEVNIVNAESMSRLEQIRLAARTTIMMGVHGNGLTSLIWMKPSPRATVMEFFFPLGFAHDYEYTTRALGMVHYGFWDKEYFTSPGLPLPNYVEGFQGNSIPIDADTVARLCVERLSLVSELDD